MDSNAQHDYIIVGGGSAGCVLANRLSANPNLRVCLLEAGPRDWNPLIKMPMGILYSLRSKALNWHFWTVPQKYCANREMFWPRGRTLGGSSSINAMCYVRGNPYDYDEWAALGCTGWSYKEVFPYFVKMENFEPGKNNYHGVKGPMNVATYRQLNPLMQIFVEAGKQAGYPYVDDYNAETQEGVGYFYVAQKEGQRWSNADGYLHPVASRSNLTIITGALAAKILFEGKKAVGVTYIHKRKKIDIYAAKEVILAAGSIGSPQLLLLSGVGPKAEIEKHQLQLVHELPGVGENLLDHLDVHITCIEKTRLSISFRVSYLWRLIKALYAYFVKHQGELTSNYTQAVGFTKSDASLPRPDLQWHFAPSVYTNSGRVLKDVFRYYGYTLMVCNLHPKSRGRLTLRDTNPASKPLLDANYLANEADMDVMLAGFKKSRNILSQAAFKPHFACEHEPGAAVQTDEQIKQYIREHSETIYHPVGTCKMGRDAMSVVDPATLKVYGLDNIRVIDASIMPTLISGNTNAPTTMIAEKGVEMILRAIK